MEKVIFKVVVVAVVWLTSVVLPAQSFAAQLIFNSGFEADSRITGGYADIAGIDRSVSSPNDWGDDTWEPHITNFYYGTSFPASTPSNPGKNVGWTDWTHAR